MANVIRLGKGATRKIKSAIDDLYDNVKVRFLGPNAAGKRIFITFDRSLSLPGIFEAGSTEEAIKPDLEVLTSLIRVAQDYLDASRERMKAKVVHSINGALAEAKHTGGMSRDDFRGLVSTKLTEVWSEAANSVHTIVDAEINHTKNVSILDGIVGANLQAGIDDPTVYFVVVRDEDLCDECKRLHLMPDGKTPRLWRLSEVSHGYHKKGEDSPSIGGLHPHCRCSLVTLMPGFGFTKDGFVSYKKMGYDGLAEQRNLERSMPEFGSVLAKAERGAFDPNAHPRDPNTGEFIDHEAAYLDSIAKSSKFVQKKWNAKTPEQKRQAIEHARRVFRAFFVKHPELYQDILVRPYLASEAPLDANDDIVDTSEDDVGASDPEDLGKAGIYPGPIFEEPRSDAAKMLHQQIRNEALDPFSSSILPTPPIRTANNLAFGYKYHSHGRRGQLFKYAMHRHLYLSDYEDPGSVADIDADFDFKNKYVHTARKGVRGTQAYKDRKMPTRETLYSSLQLKHDLGHNPHLYDQLLEHMESLKARLRATGLRYKGNHFGRLTEPHYIFARAFRTPEPQPNGLLASFSDTVVDARTDPALGMSPHKHVFYYAVPESALVFSYHHGGKFSYAHNYRTSENEFLHLPHEEKILPADYGMENIRELVPAPEGIGTSGKAALSSIPKRARQIASDDDMNRPFILPPPPKSAPRLRRSEGEPNDTEPQS